MNTLKKVLGYPLLTIGGVFLLIVLFTPFVDESRSDKVYAALGGLMLGLPLTISGGLLVRSASGLPSRVESQRLREAEQDRLQRVLYQLLESNDGKVTLVQFAIAADVPADEARTFMNAQATAFSADFDVTDNGSIVYQFPIS